MPVAFQPPCVGVSTSVGKRVSPVGSLLAVFLIVGLIVLVAVLLRNECRPFAIGQGCDWIWH